MRAEAKQGINSGAASAKPRLGAMRVCLIVLALTILLGWRFSSEGLFTVDEFFYVRMSEAMAGEGALSFRQFDVERAPALSLSFAQPTMEGVRLTPQYPSGYAFAAAPFYAFFGVKGLALLNALAGIASLALTMRIARRLGAGEREAASAALLLAFATYWSSYLYAIWPHMLALALALGVIDRLLAARDGDARAALTAGLIAGIGQTIRIDMIVLAPAAIFWFRLFCDGATRRQSLTFVAGLAPGLLAAAALNFSKFGQFNPFTYENAVSANDPAAFLPLALFGVTLLAAVFILDVKKITTRIPACAFVVAAIGAGAAALLFEPLRSVLNGYFYSLVDAQSYAHLDRQVGIERNDYGWLVFYGFSKKALLQSIPFAALAILPMMRFFRGALSRDEALLFLVAGAFATLYSVNGTDSGLGLNARFLLPIAPIACIIAMRELGVLVRDGSLSRAFGAKYILVGFSAFLALRLSIPSGGALETPLDLYPQLALAAALAFALMVRLIRPAPERARIAALVAFLAIGASGAIGATDFLRDQFYRAHMARQAQLYADAVPNGSIVFTSFPTLFATAFDREIGVAYPGLADINDERAAVAAYQAAGRCAYAQGTGAAAWRAATWADARDSAITLPEQARQGPLVAIPGNPSFCP